jgi:hypothetical protein
MAQNDRFAATDARLVEALRELAEARAAEANTAAVNRTLSLRIATGRTREGMRTRLALLAGCALGSGLALISRWPGVALFVAAGLGAAYFMRRVFEFEKDAP